MYVAVIMDSWCHAKLSWAIYWPVQASVQRCNGCITKLLLATCLIFQAFVHRCNSCIRKSCWNETKLSCFLSIDLLHFGCLICRPFHFLKWWEVVIITQAFIVII